MCIEQELKAYYKRIYFAGLNTRCISRIIAYVTLDLDTCMAAC